MLVLQEKKMLSCHYSRQSMVQIKDDCDFEAYIGAQNLINHLYYTTCSDHDGKTLRRKTFNKVQQTPVFQRPCRSSVILF